MLLLTGVHPLLAGDGYGSTPAIVQIPVAGQHDTVGFNIAKELPGILYKRILEGKINLYETPLKEKIRTPEAFQALEEETGTYFQLAEDIFLDEDWKLQRRNFEFTIRGIYCLNRSPEGQQVNYGYIDIGEIKEILKSLIISTNCNGPKNLTFWDALHSKRYAFNLVKFGDVDFRKNPEKSFLLKQEAFFKPKVTTNAIELQRVKEVEYVVDSVDFNDDKMNSMLFEAIESYFKQNPHEFFNLGGVEFTDFLNPQVEINLTRIVVTETWRQTENGLTYQTDQLVVDINGRQLLPISIQDLRKMGLLVNFRPLEEFLEEKNYFFTIIRVNDQQVYAHQAQTVLNGLLTGAWHKILINPENNNIDN